MEVCGYYLNEENKCLYILVMSNNDLYSVFKSYAPLYNHLFSVNVSNREICRAIKKRSDIVTKNKFEKILINRFFSGKAKQNRSKLFPNNTIEDISFSCKEMINKKMVIYCGSTFNKKKNIYIHDLKKDVFFSYDFKEKKLVKHKPSGELVHEFVSQSRIPCVRTQIRSNKFVFYLHGGPNFSCDYSYDETTKKLVKKDINVIKINYPGSVGYSANYEKMLLNRGSIVDVEAIKEVLAYYKDKFPNMEYVIWGDSYGAYISAFFSICKINSLKGIVATGGFTSIEYMLLFSNSREIIFKFLNNDNAKKIHNQLMLSLNQIPISMIQGSNDQTCPIFPLNELAKKNKKIKLIILENFGHYEFFPSKKTNKATVIFDEICSYLVQ